MNQGGGVEGRGSRRYTIVSILGVFEQGIEVEWVADVAAKVAERSGGRSEECEVGFAIANNRPGKSR